MTRGCGLAQSRDQPPDRVLAMTMRPGRRGWDWLASDSRMTCAPARTWPCRLVALRQKGTMSSSTPTSTTIDRRERQEGLGHRRQRNAGHQQDRELQGHQQGAARGRRPIEAAFVAAGNTASAERCSQRPCDPHRAEQERRRAAPPPPRRSAQRTRRGRELQRLVGDGQVTRCMLTDAAITMDGQRHQVEQQTVPPAANADQAAPVLRASCAAASARSRTG